MNTEKEKRAIEYLKAFEPEEKPYFLCYSGGKDSDVIRILAQLAGVKHEIHHSLTTVDSPMTVKYVKSIPGVIIDRPAKTMWQLIVQKLMPPTRIVRYCCAELKEKGGAGYKKITGVRWAESVARASRSGLVSVVGGVKSALKAADEAGATVKQNSKGGLVMNMDDDAGRRFTEMCYRTHTVLVNPIIDWTDEDVWSFLHHYGCPSNPEYQRGRTRVGCINCPISTLKQKKLDFYYYPKYKDAYLHAYDKMLKRRRELGYETQWKSAEEVLAWCWDELPGQTTLEDFLSPEDWSALQV